LTTSQFVDTVLLPKLRGGFIPGQERWNILLRVALGVSLFLAPLAWVLAIGILVAIMFACAWRPPRAHYALMLNLLILFLPAAFWNELVGAWSAGLWALVALPPLDDSMRVVAPTGFPNELAKTPSGRKASSHLWSLVAVLTLVTMLAAVVANAGLAVASGVAAGFLLWRLSGIVRRVPPDALLVTPVRARVMAGESLQYQIQVTNSSTLPLHVRFFPDAAWLRIEPLQCNLQNGEAAPLEMRVQTSLAGPRQVALLAAALDPWGLLLSIQSAIVAEITVIPRARVASWLARQFLEGAATGVNSVAALSRIPTNSAGQQEYYRHRPYLPGDRGNQIDWRRALKFRELIVKEFSGAPARLAVLVAGLQAEDEEAMDQLAWDVMTYSLTLAQEGVPTAIAAYGQDGLTFTAPTGDPKEAVRQSLTLLPKMSQAPQDAKALGAADVSWLRKQLRNRRKPGGLGESVERFLNTELSALEFAAKDHPLTKAVSEIKRRLPHATVFILSRSRGEQDVVAVSNDALERAGYDVHLVNGIGRPQTARSSPQTDALTRRV